MSERDDDTLHRRMEDLRSGGLRHAVQVPARIEGARGGTIDAEVLDVGSGGMYLRHPFLALRGNIEVLPVGSTVTVVFAPDHQRAPYEEEVRIRAQVVRRHAHGIGVRFQGLTQEHKRALRTLALRAVESRAASSARKKRVMTPSGLKLDGRAIMSACRKVLERSLPTLIWMLRTEVEKQLRVMATNESGEAAVAAATEAGLIERKGTAISRTVERRVIQSFAEVGDLDATQELVLADVMRAKARAKATARTADREAPAQARPAPQKLGLMQEKAVERSVAMEATCQRLESELTGKSFDVNIRLANVLGRRIDDIENPLVPAVMCRMLWQAVTEHADSPRVHTCMQRAMVRDVKPLLFDLYEKLDKTLDEQGVPGSYYTSEAMEDGPDG